MNGVPVRSGYGEYQTANGMVYKGDWESDKMNGKGESFKFFLCLTLRIIDYFCAEAAKADHSFKYAMQLSHLH